MSERDPRTRIGTGYIYYRVGPGFCAWGVAGLASSGDDEYRAHLAFWRPYLEYAGYSFVEDVPASERQPEPPQP